MNYIKSLLALSLFTFLFFTQSIAQVCGYDDCLSAISNELIANQTYCWSTTTATADTVSTGGAGYYECGEGDDPEHSIYFSFVTDCNADTVQIDFNNMVIGGTCIGSITPTDGVNITILEDNTPCDNTPDATIDCVSYDHCMGSNLSDTKYYYNLSPLTRYVILIDGGFGTLGGNNSGEIIVSGDVGPSVTKNSTNLLCSNDTTGTASIEIEGGVFPYTYSWSTGSTDSSLTGLTEGAYTITYTDSSGCSDTAQFNITSNAPASSFTDVQFACDSLVWVDGITYYSDNNTAVDTLTNVYGCDSIVSLDLTVEQTTYGNSYAITCDEYTWINGVTYTSSNYTAMDTLTNAAGCDSIVTLNLDLRHSTSYTDILYGCDSLTWIDTITYYNSNNSATFTIPNSVGCDSVISLDLTMNFTKYATHFDTACDYFTWANSVSYYFTSDSAGYDTLISSTGCDSVINLDITILESTIDTHVISACDSYTWVDGNTYTSNNNTGSFLLTNAAGCDSIVYLDLTINYTSYFTDTIIACDSLTWIDGVTYYSSNNTATHTLTNSTGCDSIVTLDLTIYNQNNTAFVTACDSFTWVNGITYTANNNTDTVQLINSLGCDSLVTLNLTINQSTSYTDVIVSCDSYTWIDGVSYTSSNNTATDTLVNSVGCDSVVFLDLTILQSTFYTYEVQGCDSLTWIDGNTYYADNNTATLLLPNSVGCDSLITLDLTMGYTNSYTDVITACDSLTWIDGITYTSNNNSAMYTLTNVSGCDSIVSLDLTIINSTTYTDTIVACETYTWIDGNTYTSTNNSATHILTNSVGCDSIVTLDLTILRNSTYVDEIIACVQHTWIDGNTYTSSNNTATHTLTNSVGCDSLVILNLTINPLSVTTDFIESQTLEATVTGNFVRYEWVICLGNDQYASVVGDSSSVFTPKNSGNYAVMVYNQEGCVDTSDCKSIIGTGLETEFSSNSVTLYPNPNSGEFIVQFENQVDEVTVTIYTINGQEVYRKQARSTSMVDVQFEGARGLYLCRISLANGESQLVKLIVD